MMTNVFSLILTGDVTEVRKLLMKNLTLVNDYDPDGYTPLHIAVYSKNTEIVNVLLEAGADINLPDKVKGQSAIHYAAVFEDYELFCLLLEKGNVTSIDPEDNYGNTPLWTATFNAGKMAAKVDSLKIVKHLVSLGADGNHKNKAGKSPVDFAMQIKSENLIETLKPD